jgi:hypothetical protein
MPIRVYSKFARVVSLIFCVTIITACAVHFGDEAQEQDLVEETEQAIGEPSCATLPQSATYTGFVPSSGYTSPQMYDPLTCDKALSIQVNNYSSSYVGTPGTDYGGMFVDWADTTPTTQSTCQAAHVRADLYRQILGVWQLVSTKQAYGTWYNFFGNWICNSPGVGWRNANDNPDFLIASFNYRIVSTARTSTGSTRKFRVYSTKDGHI